MKDCSFSCMECWSVRGQYPTSLELLWVNLLDLGKFFNSHNLDYLLCSKNAPDLCFNYYTFHIHTSLSKFFFIRSAVMLLTSKLAYVLCWRCLQVFSRDHSEPFLLVWFQFTQTRTNEWLLCQLFSCYYIRDDAAVWRGPKKNGIYSFMLFTYIFFDLPCPVQACDSKLDLIVWSLVKLC